MATKTSLLGLTKPAYTEAADIAVLNTNFDLIDKAIGQESKAPNLIVNGSFQIWSQGTKLENVLTITEGADKWKGNGNLYRTYEKISTGCRMTTTTSGKYVGIQQRIPSDRLKIGKYTLVWSFTPSADCATYSGKYVSTGVQTTEIINVNVTNSHISQGYYNAASMGIFCASDQSDIPVGFYVDIHYVAFYEGTYDADTLPTYVVPDKRIEMIRCGVPLNPPNLLDNSWFVNPINQRGATNYSGNWVMCIDRWRCTTSGEGKVWVSTNNVGVPASGRLIQCVNVKTADVVGKSYTLAVADTTGKIRVANGIVKAVSTDTVYHINERVDDVILWLYSVNNSEYLYVTIRNESTYNQPFTWAALYEGAYDAETLPEYHYKGYAAELAECQRFYIKIATQPVSGWCYNWGRVTVFVPLPVTMRVASPTVSVTSASRNFYIGSTAYAAEPTGSTAVSNGISVYFSHSHTGNGQCIMPEFSAEVSADF